MMFTTQFTVRKVCRFLLITTQPEEELTLRGRNVQRCTNQKVRLLFPLLTFICEDTTDFLRFSERNLSAVLVKLLDYSQEAEIVA